MRLVERKLNIMKNTNITQSLKRFDDCYCNQSQPILSHKMSAKNILAIQTEKMLLDNYIINNNVCDVHMYEIHAKLYFAINFI